MGYYVSAEFRNRGYVTEACRALISWARSTHGVKEFQLQISPDNAPSVRVAEKLGFDREGQYPHDYTGTGTRYRYRLTLD
jgi:RimJ/RimL family protein N-acetyltransferase